MQHYELLGKHYPTKDVALTHQCCISAMSLALIRGAKPHLRVGANALKETVQVVSASERQ